MSRYQTVSKSGHLPGIKRVPSLEALRREGRASFRRISEYEITIQRTTKQALLEWLDQSERLWIAAELHELRGVEFVTFAADIGIRHRSSAYKLLKLHPYRDKVLHQCRLADQWPGWETALAWVVPPNERSHSASPMDGVTVETMRDQDHEWGTPLPLFHYYHRIYKFDCDVASTTALAKCRRHITREQDGLVHEWGKSNWMNPPYKNLVMWCKKAWETAQRGTTVVGLLPVITEQAWFRDYASHGHIELLQGRLVFEGADAFAPFASMVVVWQQGSARNGN